MPKTSDELCSDLVEVMQCSFCYGQEGFTWKGQERITQNFKFLVEQIKKEVLEEVQRATGE